MRASRFVLPTLLCAAIAASACGSDSQGPSNDSSAISAAASAGRKAGSPRTERAVAAGKAAADKAGGTTQLPVKTVGILQLNAQAEVAARIEQGAKDAAKAIGWKSISCDSQGDPAKMASCGASLLNQNVDVVMSIAIEPAAIEAQLQQAKAKHVPWLTIGGGVTPDDKFAAQYAPRETEMATLIDHYLIDQLAQRPSKQKTIAISTFSQVWAGKARSDALHRDLAGTGIKIVDEHQSDLANQIEDAQRSVTSQLTAYPNVDGLLGTADYPLPVMGRVVAAKFPGKSFPDRPLVVGYLDDLVNLDAIRKGQADALATMRLDTPTWVAVDQAAEYFARKTPFNPDAYLDGVGAYGLTLNDATLITKDKLPPAGQYVQPKEDFESLFRAKWEREFGVRHG